MEQAKLDYELRLVTNMTTELRTELTTQTDMELANSLRDSLSNIFRLLRQNPDGERRGHCGIYAFLLP